MKEKEINLIDCLDVIWKQRKFILIIVVIVTFLAVIISLLLPKWYKATTVIMPPATGEESLGTLRTTNLSALGLGSMFVGSENQMRLLAILKSRNMLESLDKKFNFQKKYDKKFKFQTYQKLRSNLRIEVGEEEQIKISFLDKDQDNVANIVNYIVHCLDSLNISLSSSKAKENREFIENRIKLVQDSLRFFENKVANFMEENEIISMNAQLKAEVEKAAEMKAKIMSKEVEINVMKTRLGANNRKITDAEIDLKYLKRQYNKLFKSSSSDKLFINLDNVPELQKQYTQLQRKVLYFSKLLEFLGPQYEQAKIAEAKNIPTVQVIDKAQRPEWKYKPKRAKIILVLFFLSFFISVFITLLVNHIISNR